MPVQFTVSISFEADTAEAGDAIVNGISGLPAGAYVSSSASQTMTTGQVDQGGEIVPPTPPSLLQADTEEPAAEPTQ